MFYISEHGYLLLKHELSFDIGLKESYKYDTCYEAVVNGEHVYLVCYREREKAGLELPDGAFQFSAVTENYGIVEFALTKEHGEVAYTIIDPTYEMSREFQLEEVNELLDMLADFFAYYWQTGLTLISYASINEGRIAWMVVTLLVLVLLQLIFVGYVIKKDGGSEKRKALFYGVCMVLQASVVFVNLLNYVMFI